MGSFKRHDLAWLSDEGRNYALRNIQNCIPPVPDSEIAEAILCTPPIPAIIRRQETQEDGLLCIGFSSTRIIDGVRLRIGCKVPPDCVIAHKTPFDVVQCEAENFPAMAIIRTLADEGKKRHIQTGCFGSAALQIVTGLPYWKKNSDLDIYLRCEGNYSGLMLFFDWLKSCEKQSGITIDAEIEYAGDYGIKLKELFSPGKWVLGKGLRNIALIPKSDIAESINIIDPV